MIQALPQRVTLLVIALLFILPLLLAWLMYSGVIGYTPTTTRNHGHLVEPPVPLNWGEVALLGPGGDHDDAQASGTLTGHWVILGMIPDQCPEACLKKTSAMRQVHLATGRHQDRVVVALLLGETRAGELERSLRNIYGQFRLITATSGHVPDLLVQVAAGVPATEGPAGSVYLIDPLGNIMMFYEAGSDPNHLKQDLKRLLTWSKLDEVK